jgi:hypothetical protein
MNENAIIHPPWYRQFWPWVLIAIPLSAVIMGGITLWLALSNPDYLVVDEQRYDRIRSELRAQQVPDEPVPEPSTGDDGSR